MAVAAGQPARRQSLQAIDDQDHSQAERGDRAEAEEQRAEEAVVASLLVVDRQESRDRPVHPERRNHLPEIDDGQRVGECSVVGLRQVADRQDLDKKVDGHRDRASEEEETRAADLRSSARRRVRCRRLGDIRRGRVVG